MRIIEMYYDQIDWGQFPHGFAHWANEASLKADKNRTPEQREQFKQQVMQGLEIDRLMKAQDVSLFIIGAAAHFQTPWGSPPITGQAFEEDAIDALLTAGNGDPFVIHALAYETSKRALRQLFQHPELLRPLAPGEQPRKLTRAEVEAVVAQKAEVLLATSAEYDRQY